MTRTPSKSTIDFFSSHAWAYGHRRDDLHKIIRPWARGVDYQDRSVSARHPLPTDTDAQLEALLWWIIERTDVLIVMAGMYLNNRYWMEFEIEAAAYLGVPIIPVLDNGQERVPELARRYAACDDVHWRSASIRSAILSVLPLPQRLAFVMRREYARRAAAARAEALRQRPALLPQRQTIPMQPPRSYASVFSPPPPRLGSLTRAPDSYVSLFDFLAPAPLSNSYASPFDQPTYESGAIRPPPSPDPFSPLFDTPTLSAFGSTDPLAINAFAPPAPTLADILADIEPPPRTGVFGALRRIGEK